MADTNWKVGDVDGCLCTMSSKHTGYHLLHSIHLVSCFWLLHNEGLLQSSAVLYDLLGRNCKSIKLFLFYLLLLNFQLWSTFKVLYKDPCIVHMVMVGRIVGIAGVWHSLLLVCLCCLCTFLTGISLSAIATNGAMKVSLVRSSLQLQIPKIHLLEELELRIDLTDYLMEVN